MPQKVSERRLCVVVTAGGSKAMKTAEKRILVAVEERRQ